MHRSAHCTSRAEAATADLAAPGESGNDPAVPRARRGWHPGAMTQPPGSQPAPQRTSLSPEEKARAEANFSPYVAQALVARGRFRVSADTPEMVELFQKVARRVGDMLGRPRGQLCQRQGDRDHLWPGGAARPHRPRRPLSSSVTPLSKIVSCGYPAMRDDSPLAGVVAYAAVRRSARRLSGHSGQEKQRQGDRAPRHFQYIAHLGGLRQGPGGAA